MHTFNYNKPQVIYHIYHVYHFKTTKYKLPLLIFRSDFVDNVEYCET